MRKAAGTQALDHGRNLGRCVSDPGTKRVRQLGHERPLMGP